MPIRQKVSLRIKIPDEPPFVVRCGCV